MNKEKTAIQLMQEKSNCLIDEDNIQDNSSQFIQMLRRTGRSNKEFETMISNLSLEDLIALKLELSFRSIKKGLYGLPLWTTITEISKDAILTATLSYVKKKTDAARVLGMRYDDFTYNIARYLLRETFAIKNRNEIHSLNSQTNGDPIFENELTQEIMEKTYGKDIST